MPSGLEKTEKGKHRNKKYIRVEPVGCKLDGFLRGYQKSGDPHTMPGGPLQKKYIGIGVAGLSGEPGEDRYPRVILHFSNGQLVLFLSNYIEICQMFKILRLGFQMSLKYDSS